MQTQYLATLCLLLAVGSSAGAAEPTAPEPTEPEPTEPEPTAPEPLITLELRGLELESALESLSLQSGRRFLLTEGVDDTDAGPGITLSSVPLSVAIKTISTVYGVCSVELPGIISFQNCRSVGAVKPSKVRLGVALVSMTPESVYERGGIVTNVQPDSVASRAGIQLEDKIVGFNGRPIYRASQLVEAVNQLEPGSVVIVDVLRATGRFRLTAQF